MKTKLFIACAALSGALLAACTPAPKNNVLTEAEKAEGWKLLFDGKTLDGGLRWCMGGMALKIWVTPSRPLSMASINCSYLALE